MLFLLVVWVWSSKNALFHLFSRSASAIVHWLKPFRCFNFSFYAVPDATFFISSHRTKKLTVSIHSNYPIVEEFAVYQCCKQSIPVLAFSFSLAVRFTEPSSRLDFFKYHVFGERGGGDRQTQNRSTFLFYRKSLKTFFRGMWYFVSALSLNKAAATWVWSANVGAV